MKLNPFTGAALLAIVLAIGVSWRIFSQYSGFEGVVKESRASTEGYDQKFIDLVNHLEVVLTRRASFAYPGGKDPMTGRRREVASMGEEASQSLSKMALSDKVNKANKGNKNPPKVVAQNADKDSSKTPELPVDKVKLTAIIADDNGQHTAIVMDGERSQSVDVGDMVSSRKVTRITSKEITMENDSEIFSYDLNGNKTYLHK